ncbi:unnamed protein product [Macrosiphum euphorbiae]|uniref:Uncharacterized protein n=1 Tax=Macrosiphum euphorbiae TaxID=13131 RepID=A0AAV0WGR5_9HEMI|nr:unnamed protein product [Macrosiphum euphorbiae]
MCWDLMIFQLLYTSNGILYYPLRTSFNKSLTNGNLPSVWNISSVKPFLKSVDPTLITNYRPLEINLLFIGKAFELLALTKD